MVQTQQVQALVEPLLEAEGYELVLLECIPRGQVLRLYIDKEGGVTIDDCADVSRLLGDVLDGEGMSDALAKAMAGGYTLEVSSPGLDRPLVKPAHFERFVGHQVDVTMAVADAAGRRRYKGTLQQTDADGIQVEVDNQVVVLPYAQQAKARLVPQF